jgi:long-chain acyl-CoA synthetase
LPDASLAAAAAQALAREPGRPAIAYAGRWWSWGELAAVAAALNARLSELGVTSPATIAFVPRNRPSSLAALLGLIAGGHNCHMLYAFQPVTAVVDGVVASGACVAIVEEEDPALSVALTAVGVSVLILNETGVSLQCGQLPIASANAAPYIAILTSGTTGVPKHVQISHDLIARHHVDLATLAPERAASHADATPALLYFPLGNISGIYSSIPPLLRGQRVVLLDRFSLAAWRDYVRTYRPIHSGIPPACMAELLDADIPPKELASLKTMGIGAAPLDPALHARFEELYGIAILLSYGATEFAGPVCVMTPDLHANWGAAKRGSVGRALPGAHLRVVDPVSLVVQPRGTEGVLEVVSPRIGPDWIRTADIGVIDADGFLWLRGRADGAIIRGGFKLLPETIESALNQHPDIAESAVVGIADARLGQIPVAVIRLRSGAKPPTEAALQSFARSLLPSTHIPAQWQFVEQIPRNASVKTDRQTVRALFETS